MSSTVHRAKYTEMNKIHPPKIPAYKEILFGGTDNKQKKISEA